MHFRMDFHHTLHVIDVSWRAIMVQQNCSIFILLLVLHSISLHIFLSARDDVSKAK